MRAELCTEPGNPHKKNEDWGAATNRLAVVLDGLTAPGDLGTGCIHDVPWYVEKLGTSLLAHMTDSSTDLQTALAAAIESVAAFHAPTCDISNPGTPSATALALRVNGDNVEWLVLADSTIVFDCSDGLHVYTDDRVTRVNREQHDVAVASKVGTKEHEQGVSRLVEAQRKIRNTLGGYWVAGADPQAAYEALSGEIPLSNFRRAVLMTDGAARLHEFGLADWKSVLDIVATSGTRGLITAVRDAELHDPEGQRWPRYKTSDDATAAYLTFDS
ncbi:protein phosphatase 2C domain-containing protein [Saccharothrix deserti]|uniref:protein phosphatase 2C domain-containing protein n=1 Tax=Saccharothrix deserti TaxID=2593674 RepID=UPI00131B86A4|nr:protein phosphatase 2C domain-containing protein [Saccharothrix deserti]